jgi:GNAT superfamily N-acetyltransferase
VVRPLAPSDPIPEITALVHRGYARLAAMGFNYTAVDQDDEETRRRASNGTCFVAVLAGRIVGTVTLADPGRVGGTPCFEKPGVAVAGQFAVKPSLQSRGVGAALMDAAEGLAAARRYVSVAGDTSEGAAHLIAFYERRGFRVVERVRWEGKTYTSVVLRELACVAESPDTLTLETRTTDHAGRRVVVATRHARDGRILAAWRGVPGEVGTRAAVVTTDPGR